MAIVVVKKNGGTGSGGDSSPLTIVVMADSVLPNGQVRDGTHLSVAGSWTDAGISMPQWTIQGPAGPIAPESLTCDVSWHARSCMQLVAALPGKYYFTLTAQKAGKSISNVAELDVVAISSLQTATGKLTFLRAHDLGGAYGPPGDQLDVEVVAKLDTKPDLAFGVQLRDDPLGPARRAMFDLLRDAFANDWSVTIDYSIVDLKHNGVIMRVALAK